jgi:hypothetical protein
MKSDYNSALLPTHDGKREDYGSVPPSTSKDPEAGYKSYEILVRFANIAYFNAIRLQWQTLIFLPSFISRLLREIVQILYKTKIFHVNTDFFI